MDLERKQFNAAVLYLEKKEFSVKSKDSNAILVFIGLGFIAMLLFILKFLLA
jgi:hypothetical protein